MKRFIDSQLQDWAQQKGFKPLLLRGARQVGKTYAIRELGKKFDVFIEINLEVNPKAREIFNTDLYPQRIIQEISYLTKQEIVPGKTLLFFDEVQAAPKAVQALRYFYEMMPELHVVAAGSLLDFAIESVGIPVGRVEFLYMYPLSFLEFIYALEESILLKAIIEHPLDQPISTIAHDRLLRLIKEYLAIGGMPEAVYTWVQEKNALKCFKIQQTLINSYRQDFNKYAKTAQIKYLDILLDNIPLQLGKKFKYSAIPGEFRKRELAPCIDLLATAGVIHKVYDTAAQGLPLGAQIDPDSFKIIFLDVALAQVILGLDITEWLLSTEQPWVNKGEIVEAFVGQELLAYSRPLQKQQLYYWTRNERTAQAEVDYVTTIKQDIIPIEVKSGAGSTLKSMHIFLENHQHSRFGIRFSTQNYSVYENIYSYPLYAISIAIKSESTTRLA
jgi:predicted AAA+ superfamily ATPase